MTTRIVFLISGLLIALTHAAIPTKYQPVPGKEFAYVQTSRVGARPIERKEKATSEERPFETAHKVPPHLTYLINQNADLDESVRQKRAAPAPAPAGTIKIDPLKLIEKYKAELKTSTEVSKTVAKATSKRMKKEAAPEPLPTSPRPVLTTGAPPTPRSLNIDKVSSSGGGNNEKQRSRIQIKKGPNGQEYEYEYVYYYYDDDDDKETTEKVLNSHDGPARNELPSHSEEKTHYSKEAASNEVIPSGRGRSRGRHLDEEEAVAEERLPPSTRFPPRGRNVAVPTTPGDEEESKTTRARGRGKGTTVVPSAATEPDSVSEETQGSRGRTRANLRRPSLDLVDSASFNTHSGTAGAEPPNAGPSFPSDLPAGPVRFLGATPNERAELELEDDLGRAETPIERVQSKFNEEAVQKSDSTIPSNIDLTTTMMSPMDKVALDLYAILQGTQKLSGEGELDDSTATTDPSELTTAESEITQVPTTEYTTPSTTTTTTTTTTPAPTTTTTTTEAQAFGRGGFRRGGTSKRKHGSSTTAPSTEAVPSEAKPKGRFGRPSYGRPKPGGRTTPEPTHEQEVTKEEAKSVGKSRPTPKSRFGGARTRPTTTEPSEHSHEEAPSSTPKQGLNRPRPAFNSRTRGRSTTAAPSEDESPRETQSDDVPSTTKPRLRPTSGNVRPLRPGPRINIGRGRPGAFGTSTSLATEAPSEREELPHDGTEEEPKEEDSSPAPVEDKNPLTRLRNRQRPVGPVARPKTAASTPVQVRRVNPLIGRRRPGVTEPPSTEAPQESEPTESEAEISEDTEASPATSSTTSEEPRGLNKLVARRKFAVKQAGTHN